MAVFALALIAFATSTARAEIPFLEVCSDNTPVSANGVFNIDVTCPVGGLAVAGGYSCSSNSGADVLPVIVSVNTFYGGYVGGPFPTGWQTIGQTLASASSSTPAYACVNNSSGTVKIVPQCTLGTNTSPCHNNETCVDLSGGSSQPVVTNPTCQVCVSCLQPAG